MAYLLLRRVVVTSSVWIEGGKVNAVVYRSFVAKGRGTVLAALLFADDSNLYLSLTRSVANVAKELVLPSPMVDRRRVRELRFAVGSRVVRSAGYLVKTSTRYELDLLTEELRFLIEATLGIPVKVRKHRSPDSPPPRVARDEERALYELAPLDVPSDLVPPEEGGREKEEVREDEGG